MLSMKQQNIRNIARMAALLLLLLVCPACGQQTALPPAASESTETSICSFVDIHGNAIHSWYSEQDDIWYLFVPQQEDLSDLTLHVAETVTASSAGALDIQTRMLSNPFGEGNEVTLTCGEASVRVIARQSDLPSLHIVLNDATLDHIHADKNAKYPGNSIYLSDPSGAYDIAAENCVEIKGRGNSSWSVYEKKGYQLKFSENVSLMGMREARRWVLLSNASDDSMMRTQLVYQMAKRTEMAFVPSFEYIDLWIDGAYRGTYLLGEKVEVDSSRLNLRSFLGGLYEQDEAFYSENEQWFFSGYLNRHFVVKDGVVNNDAAIVNASMVDFQTAVDELVAYLYSTPAVQITLDKLSRMIDVDSFAAYYLINEYSLNREAFSTSFYWYKDGKDDVLHLGPLWDFDTCMGNDGAGYTASYGQEHILFKCLLAIPQFRQRVTELKETYWPSLAGMADQVDALYKQISAAAEMNYLRWNVLGKPNPKGGADFHGTFEEAVFALKTWLQNRAEQFSIPETKTAAASVNGSCTEMELYYMADAPYTSVRFAVWNEDAGQKTLQWYDAERDKDGGWFSTVDLRTYHHAGLYRVDVYPDDSPKSVASGRGYAEYAVEPTVWIETSFREDGEALEILLRHSKGRHDWIRLAVWSEENDQDDLVWYDAEKTRSQQWSATVDMNDHSGTGTYHIHAFSDDGLIATQTVYITRGDGSTTLFADMEGDGQTLKLTLEGAPDTLEEVQFAVWCDRGGQDDLLWYEARNTGGLWEGYAHVGNHGGAGKFMIHAYDGSDIDRTLLDAAEIYVQPPEHGAPELVVTQNQEGTLLNVTLIHAGQYDKIWFPVWSTNGNQADLVWHDGVWQNNGTWTCTVSVNSMTNYAVQAYTGDAGPTDSLAETTILVEGSLPEITNARLETVLSEDGQALTLRLLGAEQAYRIWMPVWSEEDAQDDLVWYMPAQDAAGVWICTVKLADHGSAGLFHIHVYQGTTEPVGEVTAASVRIP